MSRQCVWSDWATVSQQKTRNTCPMCGALSSCGELDLKVFRPYVFQELVMGFVFSYLALRRAKRCWNIYSTSVAKLCLLLPCGLGFFSQVLFSTPAPSSASPCDCLVVSYEKLWPDRGCRNGRLSACVVGGYYSGSLIQGKHLPLPFFFWLATAHC